MRLITYILAGFEIFLYVFGVEFRDRNFQLKADNNPSETTTSMSIRTIYVSMVTCGTECTNNEWCFSFAYDKESGQCSLYSEYNPTVMVSATTLFYIDRCPVSTGFTYERKLDLCYWVSPTSQNWYSANVTCLQKQSTLIKVDTQEKNNFYKALTASSLLLWTGATDLKTEGVFVWPDGKILSNHNNLWDKTWGQPDNYLQNDHCVVIRNDLGFLLHDTVCDYTAYFICQYNV